ncbi:MAG TPA: NADH-ubiquinone oxidoreductase-F iron-sulfur binding region domain-containing protein [Acidimicrobiia bacterium]|nr:NADH-ubiquinone oxidoreductase-F iron-sulfur binding region domain-containing protein [Acidimicrobiia bacterium]
MTPTSTRPAPARAAGPTGLPRLLAGYRPDGSVGLEEHLHQYGRPPYGTARRGALVALVAAVEASGLRGRGGAAFPTGRKMRTVAQARGRTAVVVNGSEGEPLSAKDRLVLTCLPHLALDGAVLAAEAVGADEVTIAIDRNARRALTAVSRAVETRRRAQLDPVPVQVVALPPRYVAGEETALVHFLNGGEAKPTFTPPRPFERGLGGRPTLIQNVETIANVGLIARYGPDWFRELGTADEPGSTLLTIGGVVNHGCVCEVALGTTLAAAVRATGGTTQDVSAFLLGGYYGTWLSAEKTWDVPLTNAALKARGASLGTGVVYAFPAGCCGLVASARITDYLARETAGQCGPCVYGLRAVADAMTSLAEGRHVEAMVGRLRQLFKEVRGRGACNYPDGVLRFAASALETFDDEVARHAARRRCLASEPPEMPIPTYDATWR